MGRGRSNRNGAALKLLLAVFAVLVIWMTWNNLEGKIGRSDAEQALEAVEKFYHYEQTGDFGSSWELFHPVMQQRFDKAAYIQKRAHILLQDFGVTTFQLHVSAAKRLTDWRMSAEAQPIPTVYEVEVTQTFQSPYGNFSLQQPCFAALADGHWKLLWSYETENEHV
ncbi:hypothetical protein [Paenibacillus sp. R14(2021)]|uniref:hypothetical protein n=1 Tax=Paenibacillus sp. R14(2021) TaxID=2859228 RepID=UPI001C613056|nr:hypothetical protein [Paenibacillus sp. R14(2021)]